MSWRSEQVTCHPRTFTRCPPATLNSCCWMSFSHNSTAGKHTHAHKNTHASLHRHTHFYSILLISLFVTHPRSWINMRQIDGSLNRTPHGFYDRVWQILERTCNGIVVAGIHLPQVVLVIATVTL